MNGLQGVLDGLSSAYRCGYRLVLLFDYDGTLTPIVAHPSLAKLDAGTRRLLKRLAARPQVVLGILSGRAIEDLKKMVCLRNIYYAGTSGLEVDIFGVRLVHPRVRRSEALVGHLGRRLRDLTARFPGSWVEDKRLGLTVHYRGVAGEHVPKLRADTRAVLSLSADRLRIVEGPMALEITPDLGWDKGTAIQMILRHLGGDPHVAIYAGDGANDQEALQTVAAEGGYAIGVGPDAPPAAQYRLPDQAAMAAFLGDLDASLEGGRSRDALPAVNSMALYGLWKQFLPTNPT